MISTIRNAIKMATTDISIISNNIANSGSTGFKRSEGNFLHSYAEDIPIPRLNIGFGVVHEEPRRQDHKQGSLRVTNNSLDLAVNGSGMFMALKPDDGEVTFSRDGSYLIDSAGNLITTDNRRIISAGGKPIVIPPSKLDASGNETLLDTITISKAGVIRVAYGDGEIVDAGTVALANFANSGGLKPIGGSYFKATEKSGPPIIGTPTEQNFGEIVQGHLEMSNTNVANELTKLMVSQQAFGASSRLLQSAVEAEKKLMG
jgi:flagellar hook protein FlgE